MNDLTDDPRFELSQEATTRFTRAWNRDRVAWHDADLPPLDHGCEAQTHAVIFGVRIDRCACGGLRVFGRWSKRNDRRKPNRF